MVIKSLENTDLQVIVDCLNQAFTGYFVPMPHAVQFWKQKWAAAHVDYHLSFGMFENGKLAGFIIHGIGPVNDKMVAFNCCTGVLPQFQGRQIPFQLYQHAIPIFSDRQISHLRLEVIRENERAVHVYQKIGFKVIGNYKCFRGNIHTPDFPGLKVHRKEFEELPSERMPDFSIASWDNSEKAILTDRKHNEIYCVFENDQWLGTFILQRDNKYLSHFKVRDASLDEGQKLFAAIGRLSPDIRINNIDDSFDEQIQLLLHVGLENHIDQFLMEMEL